MPMLRPAALLTLIVVLFGVLPAPRPTAAQAPAPALAAAPVTLINPVPPAAADDSLCESKPSPFGDVLTIGADKEPLVSYIGAFGTPGAGWLSYDLLDTAADGALARTAAWPPAAPAPELRSIQSGVASAAADLDGDGKVGLVQALYDSSNRLTLVAQSEGRTVSGQLAGPGQRSGLALATGNLVHLPAGDPADEIVVVSQRTNGQLVAEIFDGLPNQPPVARYYDNSQELDNLRQFAVSTGDLNGDGYDETVIALIRGDGTLRLIVLTYAAGTGDTGNTTISGYNMRWLDSPYDFKPAEVETLQVATGDTDGDYRDEIILATSTPSGDGDGNMTQIGLFTFNYDDPDLSRGGEELISEHGRTFISTSHRELALGAGDTDRDGRAEVVLAYNALGPLTVEVWNAELPEPTRVGRWADSANGRDRITWVALAVGDLDRDGFQEIVTAFRDSGDYLQVTTLGAQQARLALRSTVRDNSGSRGGAYGISVTLADWNNDSLKAAYAKLEGSSVRCATVEEPNLVSAVFAPPYWTAIQGDRERFASIGKSSGAERSNENSLTTSRSHSVSAYFGLALSGEAFGAEFEAAARVTGGYEYAASTRRTGGTIESASTLVGFENEGGGVVALERSTYNCYTYQLRQGSADVDGNLRYCQQVRSDAPAKSPDEWDQQYGPSGSSAPYYWAPLARGWANLAFFGKAAQSSTAGDAGAARANDGLTDGPQAAVSFSSTSAERAPWWQVDLRAAQPVASVRVWNRSVYDSCGGAPCSAQLKDFYVFVSDTDPRTISSDPEVLKRDPRVRSYSYQGVAGQVTNVQTTGGLAEDFAPLSGRYVRVQLAGSGVLSLNDVQVFGPNDLDPDRYPIAVSDSTPGDGWFEAQVYHPFARRLVNVPVRGNLLTSNMTRNLLADQIVTQTDTQVKWSANKEFTSFVGESSELAHNVRVGAEFDIEAGFGAAVQAGGGYEFTTGVTTETVRSTAWMTGTEVGGAVQGFPSVVGGRRVSWPKACEYKFQPYYFETTNLSSAGYQHRYMVVDYLVPAGSPNRTSDLSGCRQPAAGVPAEVSSSAQKGAPGSLFTLTARNFLPNTRATIELRRPGSSDYLPVASLTMGAGGDLVFVLATGPNDPVGEYSVRVTTGAAPGTASLAAALSAETSLILEQGAPLLRPETPPDAPSVTTRTRVYLPAVLR